MDSQENTDDSALLALQISITNNSDKSLDLLSDDFSLYDSNDEKVSVDEAIYGAPNDFQMLNTDSLAKRENGNRLPPIPGCEKQVL
ncbi:hypothetical protein NBRC111894_1244 [Sporolactobacillus inulinus]|uniref:DUF4352 domain-containing protein n=1 Tax=Sporolactobacillus inulinus TaxID=2078 RepID=A0A4Y1Z9I4_9BACL|nr:hypothetical protein [Sporolactobacillus inulinus]GAY75690.1 hypothetical protein NBRC111894_1244 [Sporolactobacillus inulinus]